ncbi:uncharacterized protein B0H64DRAFT_404721 [Chaetomium fimeti]|uniref:Defect at low temperature protein 1 n=1 Tax=Chaetomium fimeti TaxID=1854472 RepID=A0AAE0HC07_9PEZI|nr:hypothetical protein B0H64DRAFT_404721 [Chaetomium fimeti]
MTSTTMSAASLLFLIVYNFLYYFLYLVLFAFLVVTPIDLIQQGVQLHRNYDILVVLICYVVTILVVAFIYASRLYISRSVLASIPKGWVPIEKGDVPSDVRQMIVEGLARSAAIAYDARPRVPLVVLGSGPAAGSGGNRQASANSAAPGPSIAESKKSAPPRGPAAPREAKATKPSQPKPVWGEIEHPGWGSPLSHDLPSLQYDTVVTELPNLIEAKAITLAPPDPESHSEPPAPDPDAVALLQKPEFMGLREYLAYLTELAVLAPLPLTGEFLEKYEAARYSGRPLSNDRFRSLMHLFSEVLRHMYPLSPAALARYEDDGSSGPAPSESDIDNDAPRGTSPSSNGTSRGMFIMSGARDGGGLDRRSSSSTDGSRRRRPGLGLRNSSANTWQYRTAPTTPKSRHTGFSRKSSSESFSHTRHPYPMTQSSSSSSRSSRSGGAGSVIRLAGAEDATDLPYVLTY